jgi:hypothetical protein
MKAPGLRTGRALCTGLAPNVISFAPVSDSLNADTQMSSAAGMPGMAQQRPAKRFHLANADTQRLLQSAALGAKWKQAAPVEALKALFPRHRLYVAKFSTATDCLPGDGHRQGMPQR